MNDEIARNVENVLKKARKFLHIEDIDVQLEEIDANGVVHLDFLTYGWCSWRVLGRLSQKTAEMLKAEVQNIKGIEY